MRRTLFSKMMWGTIPMQSRPVRLFMSHSSQDLPFTEHLAHDLRLALDDSESVWYDAANLAGGDSWWQTILMELNRSTTCLIVCSPNAMQSHWVNLEIDIAWQLRSKDRSFRLIPLLLQPCDLRSDLSTLHYISFLESTPYQEALHKLLKTLGVERDAQNKLQEDLQHIQQEQLAQPLDIIVKKLAPLQTLMGHTSAVHCIAISGDGKTLVSGGFDGTIKVWEIERN